MIRLSERHFALALLPLLLGGAAWPFYRSYQERQRKDLTARREVQNRMAKSQIDRAARSMRSAELRAMLDHRDVPRVDLNAYLGMAAYAGNEENVAYLLDRGAEIDGNRGDGYPLTASASLGRTKVVDLLLSRGADPNAHRPGSITVLAYLAQREGDPMLAKLLKAGADPNEFSAWFQRIRVKTPKGTLDHLSVPLRWTPLMIAASRGHQATVRALLHSGADFGLRSKEGTAAEIAAREGHPETARLLR